MEALTKLSHEVPLDTEALEVAVRGRGEVI